MSPVVELGSSTPAFRRRQQPYIYESIDRLLASRGVRLVYCDSKHADGIDISGDILDLTIQDKIKALRPKCILCCNIFEHVEDRRRFALICDSLLEPGSWLLVTVPYSYPLHFDPIDTYFRPTPSEIHQMFPHYEILASAIVEDSTYGMKLLGNPSGFAAELVAILKRLMRPRKPRNWIIVNHCLLWLFRPYRVSAVLLKKASPLDRP